MPPALHGRLVTLRPAVAADAQALLAILDQPGVAEWWRCDEWERLDETDAVTFAIVLDGAVVGCIQYNEETDPDYFSAAAWAATPCARSSPGSSTCAATIA